MSSESSKFSSASFFRSENGTCEPVPDVSKQSDERAHQWERLTGQYDGLSQILKHKAQRKAGVRHGICPMKDDEAIEECVVPENGFSNLRPPFTVDGGGVQKRFKFENSIPAGRLSTFARKT